MPQELLTVDMITKQSLSVLHQKANFIGSINRDYDDTFGERGMTPKIGNNLRVRKPSQFVTRTGATLNTQDVVDQYVDVPVKEQQGVDFTFSTSELSLDIEEFSRRYIEPAVSTLVSTIESNMYQELYKEVYQLVDNDANPIRLRQILEGGAEMKKSLCPMDSNWWAMLGPDHEVELVDSLSGRFQAADQIADQYRDGVMGRAAGFNFGCNTHFIDHTTGSAAAGDTSYNINGANQGATAPASTLTVDTGTTTFLAGDVITIDGVFRVHPETKLSYGELQKFVVTADSGSSATSLAISPALNAVTGDGRQNVSAAPADNAAINKIGAGANEALTGSMVFHRDAFTFGTAGLVMPDDVDFKSQQVLDGVSVRVIRQYTINNDQFPCRLDIIPAWSALRPELAARIHADG